MDRCFLTQTRHLDLRKQLLGTVWVSYELLTVLYPAPLSISASVISRRGRPPTLAVPKLCVTPVRSPRRPAASHHVRETTRRCVQLTSRRFRRLQDTIRLTQHCKQQDQYTKKHKMSCRSLLMPSHRTCRQQQQHRTSTAGPSRAARLGVHTLAPAWKSSNTVPSLARRCRFGVSVIASL